MLDPAYFDVSKCCNGMSIDERKVWDFKAKKGQAFGFPDPIWSNSEYTAFWKKVSHASRKDVAVHFSALAHVDEKWVTPQIVPSTTGETACVTMASRNVEYTHSDAEKKRWKGRTPLQDMEHIWDLDPLTVTDWYRDLPGWDLGKNWMVFDNFRDNY